MSDNNEQVAPELKAGHPPAMKVGGMRVPLPKHVHEEKPEPAPAKEGEEDVAAETAVKEKQGGNKTVVISGAHVKEKDIYSPESARAIHEKPQPTHSHITAGHQHGYTHNMTNLMQPRKNN